MSKSRLAVTGALEPFLKIAGHAPVPGTRLVVQGRYDPLLDESRVPAPARRDGRIRDTPRFTRAIGCHQGEGGRVLSHPQELPLASAGSRRALAQTGACGQLGSRTANRMAVPQSPSIRERACPARQGPA